VADPAPLRANQIAAHQTGVGHLPAVVEVYGDVAVGSMPSGWWRHVRNQQVTRSSQVAGSTIP